MPKYIPTESDRIKPGPISDYERALILNKLGKYAQAKYDEFIVSGGDALGYNLMALRGSLQFEIDVDNFENFYYIEGTDKHWTDVALYFEYGTGLYNSKRAGRYHAGYIKPVTADYLRFLTKKSPRHWVTTDRVTGVRPVLAANKAIKLVEFERRKLQREIRLELQND